MDVHRTPSREAASIQQQWKENGVKSPPKDPDLVDPLTPEQVKKLMRREGDQRITRYLLEEGGNDRFYKERLILLYLYACGYEKKSRQVDRVPRILEFIQDDETIERMFCVMSMKPDEPSESIQYWRNCQTAVIRYSQVGGVTVFDSDMPCTGMPYVCRVQCSSHSYLQATASLVGYRVVGNPGMSMDVGHQFIHHLSHEQLHRRVVEDQGGSSKEFLLSLVGGARVDFVGRDVSELRKARILIDELKDSGPCLVHRFETGKHFETDIVFSGENTATSLGIPQFDISNGKDTRQWLNLGLATPHDHHTIRDLESRYHFTDQSGEHVGTTHTTKNLSSYYY
jgi:hypothetical protein